MDKDLLARINYVDGKKQGLSEEWNKKGEFLGYKFYNNNRCVAKGDKALERAEAEILSQLVSDKKTINAPKGKGKDRGVKM